MSLNLITLDEAAKLIPDATADTLRRLARNGKLTVYRVGRGYKTTPADIDRMVLACRVNPKARDSGSAKLDRAPIAEQVGLSSTVLASKALDAALTTLPARGKR